jgi:hypothetical protein
MSNLRQLAFPDGEGKIYDKSGYYAAAAFSYVVAIVFTIGAITVFALFMTNMGKVHLSDGPDAFQARAFESFSAFAVFVVIVVTLSLVQQFLLRRHLGRVAVAKHREQAAKDAEELAAWKSLQNLEPMMKQVVDRAVHTGDIILSGEGAVLNIGSGSVEIIRGTKTTNPDLAKALAAVAGMIENSKNKEAAAYFDKFAEQIERKEPDRTILAALWQSIVVAVPPIKQMAEVVDIIARLFK